MRIASYSLALLLISASASAQDLTIISKVTSNGSTQTSRSYISSDRLRLSQPDGNDVIFDVKSGDMTILDAKKKTYYTITQKDMDDMAAMMRERMNSPEMKNAMEQMKKLPPEQRKQMEQMMGGMFAFNVQKSGTTRTIAGYKCENWTITIGQLSKSEQCITQDVKLPARVWDPYKKFADNMKSMMSAMGPMAKNFDSMREQMEKMKGFPLATTTTTTIMGNKTVTTSEVTALDRGAIPASAWAIPSGYTRVESPMKQALKKGK
jgi:hypothetical protein